MSSILLAWSALALMFLGVGRLVGGLWGDDSEGQPLLRFWLGWGGTLVFLMLWHFLLPVDGRALGVVALVGALGLARGGLREVRSALGWLRAHPLCSGLFVLYAVWLSNQVLVPPGNPDTDLYFMQTVRWFSTYPVVTGLGNLHHRLAFNQSYHLYVSLLDVGPFFHRAHHVANGLLLLSATGPALARLFRLARPQPRATDLLWAFLLPPLLDQALGGNTSSPAADQAVFVLGVVFVMLFLGVLLDRGEAPPRSRVLSATFLTAGAPAVKLSLVCVAAPFWGALVAVWWSRARPASRDVRRLLAGGFVLGLLCLGPWMARGLVMSGYPLFPSTAANPRLPWRVPEAVARGEARYIEAFAKRPGYPVEKVLGNSEWMGAWFSKAWLDNREFLFPGAIGLLSLGGLAVARPRGRRPPLAMLVPTLAALVLWWVLAPAVRFAGPLLWLLAAQGYWVLSAALGWPALLSWRQLTLLLLGLLAVDAFIPAPRWVRHGFPPPPPEKATLLQLPSGDVIKRDAGRCWELPCAFSPDPRLRLRRPGDLSAGFTLEPLPTSGTPASAFEPESR